MLALAQVAELPLREGVVARLTLDTDQRESALEDPGVHDLFDRFARRFGKGRPQIVPVRVAVRIFLQIVAHADAERLFAEVLLEHSEHRSALLVREGVEHGVRLFGRRDGDFDWSSRR